MAKPKIKPRPRRKITAKELKAREYRSAFLRICDGIVLGKSVAQITANKKAGLTEGGFYKMMQGAGAGALVERYARAREAQADRLAEEIITIIDDEALDPQARRVRMDGRKWFAAKLKPKVYGDKHTIDVNHGVQDPEEIIARAKQAAERLGIVLPLHLLGELKVEKK